MNIDVITLFPEMFETLHFGIVGRAIAKGILRLNLWNPRDYTEDVHRTVDDRPYGGGPGMVMKFEPLQKALQAIKCNQLVPGQVIYLSPQGKTLNQATIQRFSELSHLILVAGRYEGIDERFIETEIDEEWSIGDYVVSGGELPAMLLIDAMSRLLPGSLGHEESACRDSFSEGLLDHPHYTRPEEIAGLPAPSILLSGDHQAIQRWRLKQTLGKTWQKRPDLIKRRVLTQDEQNLLDEYIEENPEKQS